MFVIVFMLCIKNLIWKFVKVLFMLNLLLGIQIDIKRYGKLIKSFNVSNFDFIICLKMCVDDDECLLW